MVEDWVTMFAKSFTDEQILNPTYMFSNFGSGGTYCKLCDARVPTGETDADHRRQHKKELKNYRQKSKAAAERARGEKAEVRRREKDMEREVLGLGTLPESKRLRNRVTSARYRLAHPEKHGREEWTDKERVKLQTALDAAQAALDAYSAKEEG